MNIKIVLGDLMDTPEVEQARKARHESGLSPWQDIKCGDHVISVSPLVLETGSNIEMIEDVETLTIYLSNQLLPDFKAHAAYELSCENAAICPELSG